MKLTAKELSDELGVSRQAVFNHIKRNFKNLNEHVEKQGNKIYIDEVGQDIIRNKSYGKPPSLMTDSTLLDEVEKLRKENSELKDKVIDLQAQQFKTIEILTLAKENQTLLEESRINVAKIMEEKDLLEKDFAVQLNQINDFKENEEYLMKTGLDAMNEIEELKNNLEAEKNKTWWDKLRGR